MIPHQEKDPRDVRYVFKVLSTRYTVYIVYMKNIQYILSGIYNAVQCDTYLLFFKCQGAMIATAEYKV